MKKYTLIFLFLLTCVGGFAQRRPNLREENRDGRDQKDEQGVEFILGAGAFRGSNATANYYNGIPSNEHNLNYIFNNYSWKSEIDRFILQNNPFISAQEPKIHVRECPKEVKYKIGYFLQLGARYRFNGNWAISLNYYFTQLKTADKFSVGFNKAVLGNETPDILLYDIVGKEHRSMIDVVGTYLFTTNSMAKPFLELGVQFNFARVKSVDAIIEGKKYSLIDIYGGQPYVANTPMQTFKAKYGGPGFGISAAFGVKLVFNKFVSMDPTFYAALSRIGLRGYETFGFNCGLLIRFSLGGSFINKN